MYALCDISQNKQLNKQQRLRRHFTYILSFWCITAPGQQPMLLTQDKTPRYIAVVNESYKVPKECNWVCKHGMDYHRFCFILIQISLNFVLRGQMAIYQCLSR